MIPRKLIERLFEAASIQRWNDRVRPVDLTELDKQAHKAMIAFLLARYEEDNGEQIDWIALIEGLIFEYFPRVVLTDIKAPFFHRLMAGHGDAIRRHVKDRMSEELESWDGAFASRFYSHLFETGEFSLENRILDASHYLASQWEFRIVYSSSSFLYGIEQTRKEIENQLKDHVDLVGVRKVASEHKVYGFIDLCGQLRFQRRWAQLPRSPSTSVLGHSLFVAITTYLLTLEIEACKRRRKNDFLTALFHDFPEVFTRDIISPVKREIEGLEGFIEQEEKHLVRERLLPLIPSPWHADMMYYMEEPFRNKCRDESGRIEYVDFGKINTQMNENAFDCVDGEIVRGCDELAAYVEACKSIENGLRPPQLVKSSRDFACKYRDRRTGSIEWGGYFEYYAGVIE
jgi:putative hydrolase of HD superfamily